MLVAKMINEGYACRPRLPEDFPLANSWFMVDLSYVSVEDVIASFLCFCKGK